MRQFRIRPYRATLWAVQRKWGPFWLFERRYGYDVSYIRTFETEAEAEEFILDKLANDAKWEAEERLERERQRTIAPRLFP